MFAIFKKEFNTFFAGPVGYMVVGLFLLFNGLLLWFFEGNWNIIDTGFADMQSFFDSTPWLFLLLIPVITMRSFCDEFTSGTIEILKTRPLTNWQIVMGKFWAYLALIVLSLLPTVVYAISISILEQSGSIDWGTIIGSYIGLFFLGATFTAIGIFSSIVSKNQILAFLIAVLISFVFYYGIEQWAIWYPRLPDIIHKLSLYEHYKSIGKGVLDTRNLVYFISISFIFLFFTRTRLEN